MRRRTALQFLGGGAAALAFRRVLANSPPPKLNDEYFVFIHAAGGWDVTLWSDPRNEKVGIVDPASSENTETAPMKLWKNAKLDGEATTFEILAPSDVAMRFGPGIGDLYDLRDRITVVNGLAMNTVSHPDGTAYSATGRHLQGGRPPASSIDVAIANELGTGQLIPDVAVRYPAWYIGEHLDRRAVPLRVGSAATIAKSLSRSDAYLHAQDREQIASVLGQEGRDLATTSTNPEPYQRLAAQLDAEQKLITDKLAETFTQAALQAAYPQFNYKAANLGDGVLGAAFAVEAIRRNLVRCVGFSLAGLDTHTQNYRQHGMTLVELFGTIATLVKVLDATPHPTIRTAKLSEHTHIYVFSDFCRTPQINLAGGRDHYPNNSALVISKRFLSGRAFGKTDTEQLLPADAGIKLAGGTRPLTPPDLMATFLHAFGVDPGPYVRDGEVVQAMLAAS
jgi:hypothetical protein